MAVKSLGLGNHVRETIHMIDTIETLARDIPKWKRMGIWPAEPPKESPDEARSRQLASQRKCMNRLRAERSGRTEDVVPRVRVRRAAVIRRELKKELKRIRSLDIETLTHAERLKLITPVVKRQQNIRANMRRYRSKV